MRVYFNDICSSYRKNTASIDNEELGRDRFPSHRLLSVQGKKG